MRVLIVYTSLTKTTETVAFALAQRFKADLCEIQCARYAKGFFRYFKVGFDSLLKRRPPIQITEKIDQNYDLIIIGAPVWTSYPATPLCSFLETHPELPSNVGAFFTYSASFPAEKTVTEIEKILGRPVIGALALKNEAVWNDSFDEQLNVFVQQLTDHVGDEIETSHTMPTMGK